MYRRLAKLDQKIANQREDYHWKLANHLVRQADFIVFEDLNIKGMTARCKPKKDKDTHFEVSSKSRDVRPKTGKYLHNNQAAVNILNHGLKILGISPSQLCRVPAKVTPESELTDSLKRRSLSLPAEVAVRPR